MVRTRKNSYKPAITKSKHQDEAMDRISDLPDDILIKILSLVHLKCIVGTSLLSRRWRYLFQFTSYLYFDDRLFPTHHKIDFREFVHFFMVQHKEPTVKEFVLQCYENYDTADIHEWVNKALMKQVQDIYLCFFRRLEFKREGLTLPSTLFQSNSLQVLKLSAQIELVVPETVGLPNLKVLYFTNFTFDHGQSSIGKLLSNCKSLRVLTLRRCTFKGVIGHFQICSPTLEDFTFNQTFNTQKFEINAPSLQKATFKQQDDTYFWCTDNSLKIDQSAATYLLLQVNINNKAICSINTPAHFNLTLLELGSLSLRWEKELIDIICNSRRLQTVIFKQGLICVNKVYDEEDKCRGEIEEWFKDSKVTSLSMYMEVIRVFEFSGNKMELCLVEHILRNAVKLKRLILYKSRWGMMNTDHELKLAKKLLDMPRKSDSCIIKLV